MELSEGKYKQKYKLNFVLYVYGERKATLRNSNVNIQKRAVNLSWEKVNENKVLLIRSYLSMNE